MFRFTSTLLAASLLAAPAWAQTTNEPTEVARSDDASPSVTDAPPPLAITGSAGIVSQYRFRGISLSDEELAV
ncbi:MAG: hypothetical protein AVDCRST_MAG91-2361, partial [uncultured Sphingomonadaceae bacterium]